MPINFQQQEALGDALGLNDEAARVDIPEPRALEPTNSEILQAHEQANKSDASFWELMGTSFRIDNSAAKFNRYLETPEFFYDREFDFESSMRDTADRLEALGPNVDREEVGDILGRALNADHYEFLLADLERKRDQERQLAEAGAKGFAARVVANLLDPVDVAVAAVAAPIGAGAKLTRLGAAVKAATAAGVSNASIEAYVAANNPYRDGRDVAFAFAAGITLGGPLGALTAPSNARLRKLADDIAKEEMDRTGARMVAEAVADQPGADSAGAARRILDDGGDLDLIPTARETAEELGEGLDVPKFAWGWTQKLQRNYISRLFFGASDTTKRFASRIIEGGILVDRKATRAFTAEGRMNNLFRTSSSRMFTQTEPLFQKWAKNQGYGSFSREIGIEANERFYTEVGQALRDPSASVSSEATTAAGRIRPLLDDYHAMARDVGLPGFDGDRIENFFPRVWHQRKLSEVFEQVEDGNVAAWFREALLNQVDEIDEAAEDLAQRIAEGFTKALRRRNQGMDMMLMHGIPLDDMDRLRDLFDGVIDEDGIEEIVGRIQRARSDSSGDAGNITHGRQRLRFDEAYSAPVRKRDGTTMMLTLDQMTNTDAGKVVPRYFQVMGGWIGLAKEANIRSNSDIENIIKTMQSEGADADEVQAFRDVIDLVTGRSVEENPTSGIAGASRLAAAYDYMRFGGSFGLAQLPELGNIIGEVGIRTFIRNIPEYGTLLRRAADGKLTNEMAAELEELVAAGTDYAVGHARRAFDDFGVGFKSENMEKVDGFLQSGSRLTSIMSGMAPINAMLERVATFDIAQDWALLAKGSKKINDAKRARLRVAGLSNEMQERIFEQIRRHSKFDGEKMTHINSNAWDDLEAVDSYRMAIDRQRKFVIQRNDIGNTGRYIHTPIGRMLTRFMNFMLNSINKQLLRNVHARDIQTFVSFTSSMFIGGLVYVAQTSIDSAGNDEKRRERLEPERIAAAAYQRAGFAAITVPIIDSTLTLAGQDPLFKFGRTSGLGTDLITGNPTITGAQDIVQTGTLPIRMLLNEDYRFSQDDMARIERLIPLQRVLGVKNAFHAIEDELSLPRRSQSQ